MIDFGKWIYTQTLEQICYHWKRFRIKFHNSLVLLAKIALVEVLNNKDMHPAKGLISILSFA